MTTVSITVASPYDQVKLALNGIPDGVTPINVVDGSDANTVYYMAALVPANIESVVNRLPLDWRRKNKTPCPTTLLLTGSVLGNDEISIAGYTGTYYTVTIADYRSQYVFYEKDFEIVGDTFDLDTESPL